MKTSTFNKRTSKVSKGSKGYQIAKMLLSGEFQSKYDKKVRTCWTSGSGRFCKNMDYTEDAIEVLELAGLKNGIDFELKNDSPRGGKPGNYLELTPKGKRKMITE